MNGDAPSPVDGTVLITVDSLRADALKPGVAPTLCRLGRRGAVFDRAFAHGNWTPFAFPSLLGSAPVFADSVDVGLPNSPALAEVLRADGVATAGFNAANGFVTGHWGYDRGFDRFESFVDEGGGRVAKYLAGHPTVNTWLQLATFPLRRVRNRGRHREPVMDLSHLGAVERRARSFLEGVDPPFFLWVHYMDAHTPYVPAPEHLNAVGKPDMNLLTRVRAHLNAGLGRGIDEETVSALRSLYAGAVHQVDASVGRLLDALAGAGLRDSTLVVLTGDHGEEFTEHGHLAHYPKLYDELIRVPLLVDVPGAAPRRVSAPVGHRSVPPTVCDAMGVDSTAFDGESLLPAVREGSSRSKPPITSVAVRGPRVTRQPIPRRMDDGELLVSARTERFTYIYHAETGRRELYDRSSDPGEQRNCHGADCVPEGTVGPLHAAVERRLDRLQDADAGDTRERDVAPVIDRRLKALGYQ